MIKPEQSFILLTNSGTTSTLYCNDIEYERVVIPFERAEFKHDVLKKAPESSGVEPQIVTLIYGVPAQITSTGAVATSARNLQPNDADLANIFQKFVIDRYTLTGFTSLNSDVTNANIVFLAHRAFLDRFEAHQKYANGYVSFQELTTLQAETFSYLTATVCSFTSNSFGVLSNILVRDFKVKADYDVDSPALVLKDWSAVLDVIQIVADTP